MIGFLLLLLAFHPLSGSGFSISGPPGFSFDLLHINDIHAHFEPLSAINSRCHVESNETCYGGLPRLFHTVQNLRSSVNKSLFLNAGDFYEGTIWYSVFKYKPITEFSNLLNYSAASLGNHEFDDGLTGLKPFLENINFPILACNIKYKGGVEPIKFQKSIIDSSLGVRIGIIGYITTETAYASNASIPEHLEFTEEVACLQEEAAKLKKQGVQIIIALGHSGYEKDKEIAANVSDIDLVVGGHSHTFLYPKGQKPPLSDYVVGDYPTYVTQASGKVVPVVQAFCYSKYLGHLKLSFDAHGELLTPVNGKGVSYANVTLLDGEEDPHMKAIMKPYMDKMKKYYEKIGSTDVLLKRNRMKESNLGDFVADSMAFGLKKPEAMAFMNDDGIRSIIAKGDITGEDVLEVAPFGNTLDLVKINGSSIKRVLENVAAKWGTDTYAPFLEVSSALHLEYNISEGNAGHRIVSAKVKCDNSSSMNWCDLSNETDYEIILPSFLSEGGLESPNFADLMKSKVTGNITDFQALEEYIKVKSPINQTIDGRITFLDNGVTSLTARMVLTLISIILLSVK